MKHKWIVAGMSLMLCAPLGALAILGALPWLSLEMSAPARTARNYVRVELPPVQTVEGDLSTDFDAAAILREELATAEPPAAEADREIAVAAVVAVRSQVSEPDRAARLSPASRPDGLLEVSFDLSRPDALGRSSLDVRKIVRFNGADAGQATIRVGAGSALFIASEDLRTLLSASGRADLAGRLAAGAERPFVGFDEIRQTGLNLRYDAVYDRILIAG